MPKVVAPGVVLKVGMCFKVCHMVVFILFYLIKFDLITLYSMNLESVMI